MGATSSKPTPQITINSADADVPIIPPIIFLGLMATSALLAKYVDRFAFLPDYLQSLRVRLSIFMALFTACLMLHMEALDAMHTAGSGLNFLPTANIAITGPFAYTRNPFYSMLIFVQLPMLALLFDCGWIAFSIAPMFVWLSKFVIPGEEAFLSRSFGNAYQTYVDTTPRWIL